MADWQERVQSMIMGFVFAYMVMKLFAVIANFRAGNMRVERASDADTLLASTSEAEVETETEAEAEAEPGRENSSSSSSSDEEEEAAVVESKDAAAAEEEVKLPEEKKDTTVEPVKVETEEETVRGGALEEETVGGASKEGEEEEAEEGDEGWEGVESTELEKRFGAAATFADTTMVNNPELHALYKIATEGPCSSSQPSAFQPTARAKWNAWQKLGSMPQEEAMLKYIELVAAINPNWWEDYQKGKEATPHQQADVSPSSGGAAEKA